LSASHKFKIAKLVAGSSLEDKWSVWSAPSPKVEAQALLKLVRFNGSTVETIRELIDIPAETEEYFRSSRRETMLKENRGGWKTCSCGRRLFKKSNRAESGICGTRGSGKVLRG